MLVGPGFATVGCILDAPRINQKCSRNVLELFGDVPQVYASCADLMPQGPYELHLFVNLSRGSCLGVAGAADLACADSVWPDDRIARSCKSVSKRCLCSHAQIPAKTFKSRRLTHAASAKMTRLRPLIWRSFNLSTACACAMLTNLFKSVRVCPVAVGEASTKFKKFLR